MSMIESIENGTGASIIPEIVETVATIVKVAGATGDQYRRCSGSNCGHVEMRLCCWWCVADCCNYCKMHAHGVGSFSRS